MAWSPPQRRVLIAALGMFLAYLSIRLALNPLHVSDPQPPIGPRAGELPGRIDPNTADAATLAALPAVGMKRAQDIVSFREQRLAEHSGQLAFMRPDDLMDVPGIGPAMVATLTPYLEFPTPGPTSAPAP